MRESKMKTTLFYSIIVIVALLASCSGVSGDREVRLEIPNPQGINLEKYDTIIYQELTLSSMPQGFNPVGDLKNFFLGDFAKALGKTVEAWDESKHGEGKNPPRSLLLTGTLKLDIKERSKIEDKKDDKGKKKRAFVGIQNWEMTLSLTIKDLSNGTVVFTQSMEEKSPDVLPNSNKFNFDNLFFKISNQLVRKIQRVKRM